MWVLAALAGHEKWTPRVSANHHVTATTAVSAIAIAEPDDAEQYAQPRIDVYGNEIDEAVGDYRVDPRGDMYERHSPDTALLKLTPAGA